MYHKCLTCGRDTYYSLEEECCDVVQRCYNCWQVEQRLGLYLLRPEGVRFVTKMLEGVSSENAVLPCVRT